MQGNSEKPQGNPVSVPTLPGLGDQIMSGFSELSRALQEPSPRTPRLRSPHDRAAGAGANECAPQCLEFQTGPGGGAWGEASPSSPSRTALDLNEKVLPPRLAWKLAPPKHSREDSSLVSPVSPPPPAEPGRPNTHSPPCGEVTRHLETKTVSSPFMVSHPPPALTWSLLQPASYPVSQSPTPLLENIQLGSHFPSPEVDIGPGTQYPL